MIEINLLPKELKKKKEAFKIPDVTLVFLPVAIGLIVLLVIIHGTLFMTTTVKKRTLARFNEEWERIRPQKLEVDELKKEVKKIQQKVSAIDQLMVKRILWSHKLNELSDSMIPGVWLTKLSLAEERKRTRAAPEAGKTQIGALLYLNIEGCASSAYGDETATVGRFMKSLKENKDFFDDFSRVELELLQRKTIEKIEVMNFRISCYFEDTD